ncbi:tripartite tricarboxylate transporter TctB family protein [Halarchaeum salinum]|uniref:DUF1468 domain-containing protein n=1 Tax=Halarchaeum salinum TaxID=489912 RepID=A0AAV3S8D6_9EURY
MSIEVKHSDAIASVLLLAVAVGVYVASSGYPSGPTGAPGSAFFPRLIAAAIALLSIVQLVQTVQNEAVERHHVKRDQVVRVVIPLVLLVAYVVLMPLFGFLAGTIVFLTVMMWYSGAHAFRITVPITVSISLVLFYVFVNFLHVPLPESSVFPISQMLPGMLGVI